MLVVAIDGLMSGVGADTLVNSNVNVFAEVINLYFPKSVGDFGF